MKTADSGDISGTLLSGYAVFQNDNILRPSNGHGQGQQFRHVFVCAVKLPHSPEVSGGEARDARVCARQVLGGGDSRAFFRPGADELADLPIKFHLWQIRRHQGVQRREHGAVVNWFSDVQNSSPFHRAFLNPNYKENRKLP